MSLTTHRYYGIISTYTYLPRKRTNKRQNVTKMNTTTDYNYSDTTRGKSKEEEYDFGRGVRNCSSISA